MWVKEHLTIPNVFKLYRNFAGTLITFVATVATTFTAIAILSDAFETHLVNNNPSGHVTVVTKLAGSTATTIENTTITIQGIVNPYIIGGDTTAAHIVTTGPLFGYYMPPLQAGHQLWGLMWQVMPALLSAGVVTLWRWRTHARTPHILTFTLKTFFTITLVAFGASIHPLGWTITPLLIALTWLTLHKWQAGTFSPRLPH